MRCNFIYFLTAMSYNCIYSFTQQQCHFQELILNKHCKKCAFNNYNNNKNNNNISIVRKQEATWRPNIRELSKLGTENPCNVFVSDNNLFTIFVSKWKIMECERVIDHCAKVLFAKPDFIVRSQWLLYSEGRSLTSTSSPLSSTCMLWYVYTQTAPHTHTRIRNVNKFKGNNLNNVHNNLS